MNDENVYLVIGLIAAVAFIIQTLLSLFHGDSGHGGMDHGGLDHGQVDSGADQGHDGDSGGGFLQFFTLRNVVAFALGYSWVGYATLRTGLPGLLAMVFGVIAGLFFVWALFRLMKALYGLEADATVDLETAVVGRTAEIYLECDQEQAGKIVMTLGGVRRELPALCAHPERIERGTTVRVLEYDGNHCIVEKA